MDKRERIIEILKDAGADEGMIRDARLGYYDDRTSAPNRLDVDLKRLNQTPEYRFTEPGPQGGIIRN